MILGISEIRFNTGINDKAGALPPPSAVFKSRIEVTDKSKVGALSSSLGTLKRSQIRLLL